MLQFTTYYHIFNHANGDDNLFREEKNYDFFLRKYHQHIDPIADTVAWCLMKNHFHLLLRIKSEEEIKNYFSSNFPKVRNFRKVEEIETLGKFEEIEIAKSKFLSKQFSNLFSSYTQAFNKVYQRRGSLFIKNFKRKEIKTEAYLRSCILYVHLNPVKHGFVREIEDWQHSSFRQFPEMYPKLLDWLFGIEDDYYKIHQDRKNNFNDYRELEDDLT
jgi:REP element-mobilizing transposase RayT